MKKKIFLYIVCLLSSIILCACGNKTDTTQMDEQISSFIKNIGEDKISLDEENNSSFLVTEESEKDSETSNQYVYEEYENPLDDPELLLPSEKMPQISGFDFNIPSMANMQEFNSDPIEYLGITWIPTAVPSVRQAYGKHCSLYLTSLFVYGTDGKPSDCNDKYLDLLTETINLFGEPIYEYNTDIINLDEISQKGPISLMFKNSKYYLIALIEDSTEDESIIIDYYFLSTTVPHSENNEYNLIKFVMDHDSDFNIKVYYETSEGNFVL